MPKSFIEVSSEDTPINFPSRKNSLDTDFNDFATTMDASERIGTKDWRQLTSPLSTQVREVSANPFSVSGSLTHLSVGRPMRRVCNLLKWKRINFCLNREAFMNTLKRKLNELFKDNLQHRQDYRKLRLNWTEENVKEEMLILLFMKLADSLNPRGWSSIRRIN